MTVQSLPFKCPSPSKLAVDAYPATSTRQTPRSLSRSFHRRSVVSSASSAASWRGLPSADACEVASDTNAHGQETVAARMLIHATVQHIWTILTDFEKLVDVVPNLVACEEIPSTGKRRRLRQSAGLKCSWWKLQAQALLEIEFTENSPQSKELRFWMIEGDFKEYHGRFLVESSPDGWSSILVFDAIIEPLESIPEMFFAHAVQIWLPFNLDGIAKKAEEMAARDARVSPFTEPSLESQIQLTTARRPRRKRDRRRADPVVYLGTSFVPLPSSAPEFPDITIQKTTIPSFELDTSQLKGIQVHLRKLDTSEHLHRRVVCSLDIPASIKDVWKVITDYDRLSEFVPSLSESDVLRCPPGAPSGYRRIRQAVGSFNVYFRLEAVSIMDVVERPFKEVQFRQVRGSLKHLQGKWMLESSNSEAEGTGTTLTYALEIKMPHSDTPLELIEPVFEKAAVEGLPLNLTAIKREVLRRCGRPALPTLIGDFEQLRNELKRSYEGNVLPTRLQLRSDRRTDLEKAITAHGGPSTVSERMGWKLQNKRRKPRGYWDDFENLKRELKEFVSENERTMPGGFPSKADFNNAGRVDLRRAVEKWGGINSVLEIMQLEGDPVGSQDQPSPRVPDPPSRVSDRSALEEDMFWLRSRKMEIDVHDVDGL